MENEVIKFKASRVMLTLNEERKRVIEQLECGIIDSADAANENEMISKKERIAKRKLVSAVHVQADGTPRKIAYQESKKLFYTIMPDKKRIYGASEDVIYDKLFVAYGLSFDDTSIRHIFELALEKKRIKDNVNPGTVQTIHDNFARLISDELADMDIKSVTLDTLEEYTQKLVRGKLITKKEFYKFKGVLNLVFEYAFDNQIIMTNPLRRFKNASYLKSVDNRKRLAEDNILSPEEIELVTDAVRTRMKWDRYKGYFINGYVILTSIGSGMRAGELCSLKWSDVKDNYIHIHSQQLAVKLKPENEEAIEEIKIKYPYTIAEGKIYYLVPWTKDEKGQSSGGRKFPFTGDLRRVLDELRDLQRSKGISSEYVFCHEDGEWIKTDAYETCLRRLLESLGMDVTNNHSFRKSINSNVLIPKGFTATQRAAMLGHSVETNLRNYSYNEKDNMDEICKIMDA